MRFPREVLMALEVLRSDRCQANFLPEKSFGQEA
jgi:hypothetical protein